MSVITRGRPAAGQRRRDVSPSGRTTRDLSLPARCHGVGSVASQQSLGGAGSVTARALGRACMLCLTRVCGRDIGPLQRGPALPGRQLGPANVRCDVPSPDAAEEDVAMKVVSVRLGHSSSGFTADTYTHVVPAVAKDAADRIADVVSLAAKREKRAETGRAHTDVSAM